MHNSQIPGFPGMFVNEHGLLRPLWLSINQVGGVAIPLSSMIVGAELHRSLVSTSSMEGSRLKRPSQTFGTFPIAMIFVTRLILIPWIGRVIHSWLGLTKVIQDPLLSVFALVEWSVPTANNCIIMVSIVAERLPVLGASIRADVSKCLFWQYMALPFFLTCNTILLLRIQFPNAT